MTFYTMRRMKCIANRYDDGTESLGKLDDVYLKKVFAFLQLRDLCTVAEVCKRFKAIAKDVFKTLHASKPVDLMELVEGDKHFHKEWFMIRSLTKTFFNLVGDFFRHFGPLITSLWLTGTAENGGMDENHLLNLVKRYCPSLKELTLDGVGNDHIVGNEFSIELLPLFGGLEKLSFCNRFGDDMCERFVALLTDCHNLTHLSLNGVPATMWFDLKFPKLHTLIVLEGWEFCYISFEQFLKNHEHLRVLRYEEDYIYSGVFSHISKGAVQLEAFYCNFDSFDDFSNEDEGDEVEQNVLQLSKLKSLKRLKFTCDTSTLNLLVAAFDKEETPLEYFEIVDSEIDNELIDGISKLKTMKTLKLTRCKMTIGTLANIHYHLNQLDKVVITDIKGCNVNNVSEISSNVCLLNTPKKSKKRSNEDQKLTDPNDSNILASLNDDCLMEIFKVLPLRDLCNVADACKDFRRNAQTVFQSQHSRFKTRHISEGRTDMQLAEQLFRNFGAFIQELCLDGGRCLEHISDQETLMYLACKYCCNLKLKVLTLVQLKIDVELRWIHTYFNLFYFLPELRLHSSSLNDHFGKFISVCKIPRILMFAPYEFTRWMNHPFDYLLSLSLLDTWVSEASLKEFIKLNGHLIQLIIHKSMLSSDIIKTITKYMPNLISFCFAGSCIRSPNERKNVLRLAKLESLKALTLNCGKFPLNDLVDAFVTAGTPLSEFNIYFGKVDKELLEKLNNIKTPLKHLTLRRVKMQSVTLIDVVKTMKNLTELEIDIKQIVAKDVIQMLPFAEQLTKFTVGSERSNVQIDTAAYQSILKIVKNREKYNKLCICINSYKQHVFVPKQLLQESGYWLEVQNEIQENIRNDMTDSEDELFEVGDFSNDDSYEASGEEESADEQSAEGETAEEEAIEEESIEEESIEEEAIEEESIEEEAIEEEAIEEESIVEDSIEEESSHEQSAADDSSEDTKESMRASPEESIEESPEDRHDSDVDMELV